MLVEQHAARLGIGNLVTREYRQELIGESEGHPYVIRIMLGQVAVEGRRVKPERIMANSDHMLIALFERTYNALSAGGQRVFLLLSSWRVLVPEVAIEAVLLRPGNVRFNVAEALDQLHRFSLIERIDAKEEEHSLVGVPLAAAIFGRRKLEASPLRMSVEGDRAVLMEFGHGQLKDQQRGILPRIENLYRSVAAQAQTRPAIFEERRLVLEFLAERVPRAFLQLADLVLEIDGSSEASERAKGYVRRFLEVSPAQDRFETWMKLASLCRLSQDPVGEIHAVCEAALLSTTDLERLGALANRLNNRIDRNNRNEVRENIERVIQEMDKRVTQLDGDNCSKLAWLYLNVGNEERARDVARRGLERDPENGHCKRLMQRLDS